MSCIQELTTWLFLVSSLPSGENYCWVRVDVGGGLITLLVHLCWAWAHFLVLTTVPL